MAGDAPVAVVGDGLDGGVLVARARDAWAAGCSAGVAVGCSMSVAIGSGAGVAAGAPIVGAAVATIDPCAAWPQAASVRTSTLLSTNNAARQRAFTHVAF